MSSLVRHIPVLNNIARHYKRIKERDIEKINLLKSIDRSLSEVARQHAVVENAENEAYPLIVGEPPMLHNIELTNKCPMKCIACPRPYDMHRQLGFMDMHLFKKIVDELRELHPNPPKQDINLHHFGESLMHPKFDEAMKYICDAGFYGCLSCNPLFLNEQRATRLFSAHPGKVYLMMDGFDNESFSLVRGLKNAYDLSLKNCLRALEIRNELSPKTEFLVTSIDIPHFKQQIDTIEKFWKDNYGITLYRKPYSTWNGSNKTIVDLADDTEIPREKVCSVPWHLMSITWDGLVVPCCMDYDDIYVLGDLKRQTLAEVWNSEAMQTFRAEMRTGKIRNALCWKCQRIEHVRPY